MKAILLIIILSWMNITATNIAAPQDSVLEHMYDKEIDQDISTYKLIRAHVMVESRGDTLAYNAQEDAAGMMQIRPVMLQEVNRILGSEVYKSKDRFNPRKSVEIYMIVQRHHNPSFNHYSAAMIWNCGTLTPKEGQGSQYWIKMKKQLKKL